MRRMPHFWLTDAVRPARPERVFIGPDLICFFMRRWTLCCSATRNAPKEWRVSDYKVVWTLRVERIRNGALVPHMQFVTSRRDIGNRNRAAGVRNSVVGSFEGITNIVPHISGMNSERS